MQHDEQPQSYDFTGKWPTKMELLVDAAKLGRALLAKCVPPLHAEDVIPLVGEDIAGHRLVTALSPKDRVMSDARVHCEIVGVKTAAEANYRLAMLTGFMPGILIPRERDDVEIYDHVLSRYLTWQQDVLSPAIQVPRDAVADLDDRSRALRQIHQRIFNDTYRPDYRKAVEGLEAGYVGSHGTPKDDRRNKPEGFSLDGDDKERARGALGTMKFLWNLGAATTEVMTFDGDRLVFDPKQVKKAINREVAPDVRGAVGHRSVTPTGNDDALADAVESAPATAPSPACVEGLRRLRDLRDQRDHRAHTLLELPAHHVEAQLLRGDENALVDLAMLQALTKRLGSLADRAEQAALMYEAWGGRKPSRREVAALYGVTARQIERRSEWARKEIAQLRRVAG